MFEFTEMPIIPPIIDLFTPTAPSYWVYWYVPLAGLALFLIDHAEEKRKVPTLIQCLFVLQTILAVAYVFVPRPSELSKACAWGALIGSAAVCFVLLVDAVLIACAHRKTISLAGQNNGNS